MTDDSLQMIVLRKHTQAQHYHLSSIHYHLITIIYKDAISITNLYLTSPFSMRS